MDTLTKLSADLSSPYFWVTSVFLAVGINLLSSYIKGPLDRWISERSASKAAKREIENTELQQLARRIASDPILMSAMVAREFRYAVFSALSVVGLASLSSSTSRAVSGYAADRLSFSMLALVLAVDLIAAIASFLFIRGWQNACRCVMTAEDLRHKRTENP